MKQEMKIEDEERRKNEILARYFWDNGIKAHISLKSGIWYNGFIKEVSVDFFFIEDDKDGHKVIFFKELREPIREFGVNRGEKQ